MIKRIYQLWPSLNRFYFNGLIISGPKDDFPVSISPYIVFVIVLGLYIYFILLDMLQQNIILCIGFITSFAATITFMLLSQFTDPAIIPQRPFLQFLQRQLQQQHNYDYDQLLRIKQYQRLEYLLYQSSDVHQVFCTTCHIYRPSSTSHCRRCDNCVLEVDHHCPWLNTCVGKNNYKWFILFIASLIVMMVAFCCNVVVWVNYVTSDKQGNDSKNDENSILNVYVIMCLVIVGLLIIVIFGFFVFHMVLKCKGKTTREFIKQSRRLKVERQENNNLRQRKQQQQQKKQIKRSLLRENNNENETTAAITQQLPNKNKTITSSYRHLDNFLTNNYLQPQLFYEQLFKSNSSIRFIDFRRQLDQSQEKFILEKLYDLKQNVRELKENGKVPLYQKMLKIKQ